MIILNHLHCMHHTYIRLLKTKLLILSIVALPIAMGLTANLSGAVVSNDACSIAAVKTYNQQKLLLEKKYSIGVQTPAAPNGWQMIPNRTGGFGVQTYQMQMQNIQAYNLAMQALEAQRDLLIKNCQKEVITTNTNALSSQCNNACQQSIVTALGSQIRNITTEQQANQLIDMLKQGLTSNSEFYVRVFDFNKDGTYTQQDVTAAKNYILRQLQQNLVENETSAEAVARIKQEKAQEVIRKAQEEQQRKREQEAKQERNRHPNDVLKLEWNAQRGSLPKDTARIVGFTRASTQLNFETIQLNTTNDLGVEIQYFANGSEQTKVSRFIVSTAGTFMSEVRRIPNITFNTAEIMFEYIPEDNELLGTMRIKGIHNESYTLYGGITVEEDANDFTIHNVALKPISKCTNCTKQPPYTPIATSDFGKWETTSNGISILGYAKGEAINYGEVDSITANITYTINGLENTQTVPLTEREGNSPKYYEKALSNYDLLSIQMGKENTNNSMYVIAHSKNEPGKQVAEYGGTLTLPSNSNDIVIQEVVIQITKKNPTTENITITKVLKNNKVFIGYNYSNLDGKVVRVFDAHGRSIDYAEQNTFTFNGEKFLAIDTLKPLLFAVYEEQRFGITVPINQKPLETLLITKEELENKAAQSSTIFTNVRKLGASVVVNTDPTTAQTIVADIYYSKDNVVKEVKLSKINEAEFIANNDSTFNIEYIVLYTKNTQGSITNMHPHYFTEHTTHPLTVSGRPSITNEILQMSLNYSKTITHNLGTEVQYRETMEYLFDVDVQVNGRAAEVNFRENYQGLASRNQHKYNGYASISAPVYPHEKNLEVTVKVLSNTSGKYVQYNTYTIENPQYNANAPVVNHRSSTEPPDIEMRADTSNPYAQQLFVIINNRALANRPNALKGTYNLDRDGVLPTGLAARAAYRTDYDGVQRGLNQAYPNTGNLKGDTILKREDGSIQFALPMAEFGQSYGYSFSFSDATNNQSLGTFTVNKNPLTKDTEIKQPYSVALISKDVKKTNNNQYEVEYKGIIVWQAQGIIGTKTNSPMQKYTAVFGDEVIEPVLQRRDGPNDNQILFGFRRITNDPSQAFTFNSSVEYKREIKEYSEEIIGENRCQGGVCIEYATIKPTETGELTITANVKNLQSYRPSDKRYLMVKLPGRDAYFQEITALQTSNSAKVEFTTSGLHIYESTFKPMLNLCYNKITQYDQMTMRANCLFGSVYKDFAPETITSVVSQSIGTIKNVTHVLSPTDQPLSLTISGSIEGYTNKNIQVYFASMYINKTELQINDTGTFSLTLGNNGDTSAEATKELIDYIMNNGYRENNCFSLTSTTNSRTLDSKMICE